MDAVALRWFLSGLVLPPAGPLLLALLGLALTLRARQPRALRLRVGRAMMIAGVAGAWLLSMPVTAQLAARWAEGDQRALEDARLQQELKGPSPPGAVVVLAGGVTHDPRERPHPDSVSQLTLQRLAHGARVARVSGLPILLSGGRAPEKEFSEAELMARVLEESMGLRAHWVEDGSRDTAGNARESARRLAQAGVRRVVLVTQAYHMRRAAAAFEAAGLQVIPAPHGFLGNVHVDGLGSFVPTAGAIRTAWLAWHELVGLVWYRLRGHA